MYICAYKTYVCVSVGGLTVVWGLMWWGPVWVALCVGPVYRVFPNRVFESFFPKGRVHGVLHGYHPLLKSGYPFSLIRVWGQQIYGPRTEEHGVKTWEKKVWC